jgi:hypothetical protein
MYLRLSVLLYVCGRELVFFKGFKDDLMHSGVEGSSFSDSFCHEFLIYNEFHIVNSASGLSGHEGKN